MALVDAGMPCALCGEPIADPARDTFTLTMCGIEDLRFSILDDAACHQKCIDEWNLRDEFVDYYNRHCENELHVDCNGHVAYRSDRVHWTVSALTLSAAILLCGPALALLEVPWRTRMARASAIVAPFAICAVVIAYCTVRWSVGTALLYGTVLWALAIVLAFTVAIVWPAVQSKWR